MIHCQAALSRRCCPDLLNKRAVIYPGIGSLAKVVLLIPGNRRRFRITTGRTRSGRCKGVAATYGVLMKLPVKIRLANGEVPVKDPEGPATTNPVGLPSYVKLKVGLTKVEPTCTNPVGVVMVRMIGLAC